MDKWTDRLSEYIDGELSLSEREALEAHLLSCADCGRTLEELRAVVARAGQVIDREPARELWPAIAARLQTPDPELPVPVATSPGKRRLSFSIPQLAAASIVLMLMSAGTMYMMLQDDAAAPVVAEQPVMQSSPGQVSVRSVTRRYDEAVQELEQALEHNRSQMDTATVRILEKNLAIIDRAIADARAALGQEPANPYLTKYLDAAMQRKVQLLRRAAGVARAQT